MDPHTGNALIAYARLNVPSGLKKLYERPWHVAHFQEPELAEMSDNVDILRAVFDLRLNVLTLTLRRRVERSGTVSLGLANMWDRGPWNMLVDGRTVISADGATIESCNGVEADETEICFASIWRSRDRSISSLRGRVIGMFHNERRDHRDRWQLLAR